MVAIGWGVIGNLGEVHGRDQIAQLVQQHFPEYNRFQVSSNAGQIHRFRDELNRGEIVVSYNQDLREYILGIVDGDYLYRPELPEEIQNTRSVNWSGTIRRDDLTPSTKNSLGSISTIFCVSDAAASEMLQAKAKAPTSSDIPLQPDIAQSEEAELRKDTEQRALDFLQDRLEKLAWDEMQELVAGLLRAMGYKTRVSPPGSDRGRDIIASPDGFGFQSPRIMVEVKHRTGTTINAPQIRSFIGGLRNNDNGLYVSTGGFTREARYEADRSNHHMTLMGPEDLGKAIIEHYDQMDMDSRALLPLKKIYWPT
jgi:restriction system protein